MPGTKPCTTATGLSEASDTGRIPRSRSAIRSPFDPATSTAEPGGNLFAMTLAAACADVTTSEDLAGTPSLVRCAATADGERDALLVTKASRSPASFARLSASGAPAIACGRALARCNQGCGRGIGRGCDPASSERRRLLGVVRHKSFFTVNWALSP